MEALESFQSFFTTDKCLKQLLRNKFKHKTVSRFKIVVVKKQYISPTPLVLVNDSKLLMHLIQVLVHREKTHIEAACVVWILDECQLRVRMSGLSDDKHDLAGKCKFYFKS